MKITKEQIFEAADKLVAEGKKPTVAAVHGLLGAGSFTTINSAMQEWRDQQKPVETKAQDATPQPITDRLNVLGNEVWRVAVQLAKESLAADREELEAHRIEMDEQQRETAEYADKLAEEVDGLRENVSELTFSLETERIAHEGTRDLLRLEGEELRELRTKHEIADQRLQDVTEDRAKVTAALDKANEQKDKLGAEKNEADREIVKLKGLVESLEQKAEVLRGSVQSHKEERDRALELERNSVKAVHDALMDAAQLRGEVEALRKQLEQQAQLFKQLTAAPKPPKAPNESKQKPEEPKA